jgi:hypothetical protein
MFEPTDVFYISSKLNNFIWSEILEFFLGQHSVNRKHFFLLQILTRMRMLKERMVKIFGIGCLF